MLVCVGDKMRHKESIRESKFTKCGIIDRVCMFDWSAYRPDPRNYWCLKKSGNSDRAVVKDVAFSSEGFRFKSSSQVATEEQMIYFHW